MSQTTIALGLLALLSTAVTLAVAAFAWWRLRGPRTTAPPAPCAHTPAISVLKPLKGVTPELYDNLAAFASQDYPCFELVLGTTDPNDPAVAVAERLRRDFPRVPIRVVARRPTAGAARGFNPKVVNLAQLDAAARHDLLLVSDADVRPHPGYLRELAAGLGPSADDPRPVGLVTNGLVPRAENSLGATIETLQLAGFVTPSLALAHAAGHPCVVGKSMLMPRRALRAAGGWDGVRDVLAEDYVLGRRIDRAGYRVVLSSTPLTTYDPNRSLRAVFARHLRWSQMRARIAPAAYAGELLLVPTPFVLAAGAAAARDGLAVDALLAATLLLGLRILSDGLLVRRFRSAPMTGRRLLLGPVKDLIVFAAWVAGACRRTIEWRGTRLVIGRGSVLRAEDAAPPSLEPPTLESPSQALSQPGRAA